MKKIRIPKKAYILTPFILIIIFSTISAVYFYRKYSYAQAELRQTEGSSELDNNQIIERIGKILDVPMDEIPTVATISDPEKLKNQTFFTKAKKGDKVIIYSFAKKAILYDPLTNKIIDMAPVNMGTSSASASPSAALSPTIIPLRLRLYNGTEINGLTKTIEKDILSKYTSPVEILDRDNANKNSYQKTLVINITNRMDEELQKIAKLIKADYTTKLPSGESVPKATGSADITDALIIVGKDKVIPTGQ